MQIFILHGEKDQAAADDLKAFLKTRGAFSAETETGEHGFRPLQPSDVVIALWSKDSMFSRYRMMAEKRMLDAWADGQLVLVKLDHGVLPVGLRDLAAIDASFESGRELSVWPQVERAAKEAMNRALVEKERSEAPIGGLNSRYGSMMGAMGGSAPAEAPPTIVEPNVADVRRGSPLPVLILFLVLALGGFGWAAWEFVQQPDQVSDFHLTALVTTGIVIVMLVAAIAITRRPAKRRAPPAKKIPRGNPALASMDKMLSEAGPEPAAVPALTALFVSYAHADRPAVEPVVKIVEANGRQVWIDKDDLSGGDSWAGEIVRAIKGAKGVMVMCSRHAFESDHIKREVYLADRYKKPMLPVFIEAAQPPEDFEYFFAGVQWLELFKLPEADRPQAIGKALAAV